MIEVRSLSLDNLFNGGGIKVPKDDSVFHISPGTSDAAEGFGMEGFEFFDVGLRTEEPRACCVRNNRK